MRGLVWFELSRPDPGAGFSRSASESLVRYDSSTSSSPCRADCLFQIALAHLKLGEYNLAKRRVEMLLRLVGGEDFFYSWMEKNLEGSPLGHCRGMYIRGVTL